MSEHFSFFFFFFCFSVTTLRFLDNTVWLLYVKWVVAKTWMHTDTQLTLIEPSSPPTWTTILAVGPYPPIQPIGSVTQTAHVQTAAPIVIYEEPQRPMGTCCHVTSLKAKAVSGCAIAFIASLPNSDSTLLSGMLLPLTHNASYWWQGWHLTAISVPWCVAMHSGSAGECWTYGTLNNAEYVYLHG